MECARLGPCVAFGGPRHNLHCGLRLRPHDVRTPLPNPAPLGGRSFCTPDLVSRPPEPQSRRSQVSTRLMVQDAHRVRGPRGRRPGARRRPAQDGRLVPCRLCCPPRACPRLRRRVAVTAAITPSVYTEIYGHEAILSLVALGCGVGAVPRLVLESSALRDRIVELPVRPRLATFASACASANAREPTRSWPRSGMPRKARRGDVRRTRSVETPRRPDRREGLSVSGDGSQRKRLAFQAAVPGSCVMPEA